jgi:glycosyltransferase involved in cell wall biosynthesis/GNAT superfamily N-acetyltransferase
MRVPAQHEIAIAAAPFQYSRTCTYVLGGKKNPYLCRVEMLSPRELSVVIGVYNEAEVLPELERRLTAALRALGRSYEIILIDDGSRDESLAIMLRLRQGDPEHIRTLSFTRNFGHHIALTAGLDHARGDVVVTMDADLQDQPEEIQKLLAKLDEGYDVVWGERVTRQFKWYKNFSSWFFLWLMNSVARAEVHLNSSIFRAMRKEVANDLRQLREKARYLPGLVSWLGYRQTSVPVEHGKRFAGQTKYSLWRLLKLALSTATSFSAAPLQIATISGMGAAALAVLAVLYIVIREIFGGYSVPGYASIMIAIFFFGALQLIVIGLMGEYISRIYREAQGRPLYLLKELPIPKLFTSAPHPAGRAAMTPQRLSSLPKNEQEELVEAISSDKHLPLARVFGGAGKSELVKYHLASWSAVDPYVFTHSEDGRISAVCAFAELEWDSSILGFPTGRILYANGFGGVTDTGRLESFGRVIAETLEHARERNIRLIDARVSNEDLFISRTFESAGFHLVDLLVTLGAPSQKFDSILAKAKFERVEGALDFGGGLIVRPMKKSDVATLAKISELSYGDHSIIQDRFFLEPIIPEDRAQKIFREWFMNLANRHEQGSGTVLVAELNGSECGYIAFEPMAKFSGDVWLKDALNAVAPEARGRGVYRALVFSAFDYARMNSAAGFITKTQSSTYRVINSWLHLGADLLESSATLHWTNI